MGRLFETREWFGEGLQEYRSTIKVFDLLNREIEERLEDSSGNVLQFASCTYDAQGNKAVVQNGDRITKTLFNSHNLPIEITNAMGETTRTSYNHHHLDDTGQRVPQATTTDPLGYQTIDAYDAANRLVQVERKRPMACRLPNRKPFTTFAAMRAG